MTSSAIHKTQQKLQCDGMLRTARICLLSVEEASQIIGPMSQSMEIRLAKESDCACLLQFIRDIAEYEHLLDQVVCSEEDLRRELFGPRPAAEALLGFAGSEPAAFAIFFHNFSTFAGRKGLYLEDVFVRPEHRRRDLDQCQCKHRSFDAVRRGHAPG